MIHTLHQNLAKDSNIRERIEKELLPVMQHMRRDRRPQREAWLRYWRIWSVQPDQEAYKGRVQNYIPVARRIANLWIQRLAQALFPQDEWFGVRALRHSVESRVPLVKALYRYYFEKHMRLRRYARPWLRQCVTLGTSPVKVVWKVAERDVPVLRDVMNALDEPVATEETIHRVLDYLGPTFRTVDLFGFYVWPTLVTDVDEATIAFEDMLVPQDTVRRKGDAWMDPDDHDLGHLYENVDELLDSLRASDTRDRIDTERRRMQDKGFTHPLDATLPENFAPADVTEVVWRTDLDDSGEKRWLVVIGGEDIPLRVEPVPWWHGKSPWLVGKFEEVENEFYGRSLFESIDKLQYFVNDIANQASDALVWSMNPISIVDMFRMHDPNSLRMRPGAKWLGEPGAVEFKEPPKESAAMGFNALGQLVGIMREATEPVPPAPPGGSRGRRAQQSAVVQQLVAQETMTPIRDVTESLEDQVFKPMLYMIHALSWQCLDRDLVLQVAGVEGAPLAERKIGVEDIIGDFDFTWLGSTASMNAQVRSTQMINYLGIAMKIPDEQLKANNLQIDIGHILRAIWTEGFQLPNGDKVIRERVRQLTIDPRVENDLFRLGRGEDVVVSEADNDQEHMQAHTRAVPLLDEPHARQLLQKHIQSHRAAAIAKRLMQVQQQAKMQGMQNAAQPGGGGGNGAAPGNNPGRPPSTNDLADVFRSLPREGA